jgi:hypothetical protein
VGGYFEHLFFISEKETKLGANPCVACRKDEAIHIRSPEQMGKGMYVQVEATKTNFFFFSWGCRIYLWLYHFQKFLKLQPAEVNQWTMDDESLWILQNEEAYVRETHQVQTIFAFVEILVEKNSLSNFFAAGGGS